MKTLEECEKEQYLITTAISSLFYYLKDLTPEQSEVVLSSVTTYIRYRQTLNYRTENTLSNVEIEVTND